MPKREFLLLAHPYKPSKHGIGGWYMSEKLDGMRCYWDGGLTRGMFKDDVPWANNDKDGRYVTRPVATGLWSRYGNVIHAPADYLDSLPRVPLDGELYREGPRQELMSIVKSLTPDPERWAEVSYHIFDIPSYDRIFMDGFINNTNYKKTFKGIRSWIYTDTDISSIEYIPDQTNIFQTTYALIKKYCDHGPVVIHLQERIPFQTQAAIDLVNQTLEQVDGRGGEGLMLRKPESIWVPCRSHDLLKVKKRDDAEGTVVGYTTGEKTDKGSKLLGLMGALILRLENNKLMELSGFTHAERVLHESRCPEKMLGTASPASDWAQDHPGAECPEWIEAVAFPLGMVVTFKYRGKTKDGIPQEAAYWREKENE